MVASNITVTSKLKESENVCHHSGADCLKVCHPQDLQFELLLLEIWYSQIPTPCYVLLMCWVITCLSSTMTCLLFCGAEAQYWGGGAWGRKDAFNDEIPKWLEVCIHCEKRLFVNNLTRMISFVCFCLQSCSWSVPWRWCVFRRIACFCSIWPGPAKHVKCLQQEMLEGGEKISPHSTENAYTQICKVRQSKGKDKRTCMYVLCMLVNLNVWVNTSAKDIFVRYHSIVGGGVSLLGAQRLKPT